MYQTGSTLIGLTTLALLFAGGRNHTVTTNRSSSQSASVAISGSDKVGQLLLVGFDGRSISDDVRRVAAEWHVGGVVLYAPNIESPQQVAALNAEIRKVASGGVEPFIAIDQ